jgi:two-component system, cell cycle sensor histidine kinase and response regulator CckA
MIKSKAFLCVMLEENIDLSISVSHEPIIVHADTVQMEQVLVNLVSNAMDAMPGGGLLSMSTDIVDIEKGFLHANGMAQPGRYGRITVTDTGIGIDKATLAHIFEPFFTTKDVGKGTGLGLSMVFGIIRQHQGFIVVNSDPGKGSTFYLYLPLVNTEGLRIALQETAG